MLPWKVTHAKALEKTVCPTCTCGTAQLTEALTVLPACSGAGTNSMLLPVTSMDRLQKIIWNSSFQPKGVWRHRRMNECWGRLLLLRLHKQSFAGPPVSPGRSWDGITAHHLMAEGTHAEIMQGSLQYVSVLYWELKLDCTVTGVAPRPSWLAAALKTQPGCGQPCAKPQLYLYLTQLFLDYYKNRKVWHAGLASLRPCSHTANSTPCKII